MNNVIRQSITTYEQAVAYLLDVPKFTTKNTIEDTKNHLHRLGDPDRKLHIIHVAGTNGKGSVCSYMRYILEAAGYSTAVFTSPHLVDMRERFAIKGEMVSKEAFLEAFLQVYNSLDWATLAQGEGYHPTFFEYLFLMAMLLFATSDVDYCILETGLGGRLDSTNSVGKKELSVITGISLDHVEYLGDSLEKIAGEKAGIMQAGTPVVYIDTEETVSNVFRRRAEELGIPAYAVSKNDYVFLNFQNKSIDFSLHTRYYGCIRLKLRTQARYQMENASLAVRAIEVLDGGRTISEQDIIRGVNDCFWQGRMEEILPDVYVDGAHNEDGVRAFLETVDGDNCCGRRYLLFGVVADKDYPQMLGELLDSGFFEKVAIAHLQTGRSASLESLRQLLENKNSVRTEDKEHLICAYTLHDNVDTALREVLAWQEPGDRIYIVGSLYLVGEIKETLKHD